MFHFMMNRKNIILALAIFFTLVSCNRGNKGVKVSFNEGFNLQKARELFAHRNSIDSMPDMRDDSKLFHKIDSVTLLSIMQDTVSRYFSSDDSDLGNLYYG